MWKGSVCKISILAIFRFSLWNKTYKLKQSFSVLHLFLKFPVMYSYNLKTIQQNYSCMYDSPCCKISGLGKGFGAGHCHILIFSWLQIEPKLNAYIRTPARSGYWFSYIYSGYHLELLASWVFFLVVLFWGF